MRTTLDIPDDLYREVKTKAAQDGVRITDIAITGLRLALREPKGSQKYVEFPLFRAKKGQKKISTEQILAAQRKAEEEEDLRGVSG